MTFSLVCACSCEGVTSLKGGKGNCYSRADLRRLQLKITVGGPRLGKVSHYEWSDAARRGDNWVDQRRTKGTFGEKLLRLNGDKSGKLNKCGKTWAANMPLRYADPQGAVKTQLIAYRRKRTPKLL